VADKVSRRGVLRGAAGALAAASLAPTVTAALSDLPETPEEAFWRRIRADYETTPDIINLENGNWGIMSRPVQASYLEHTARVNRDNSFYARRGFARDYRAIRERVAAALGASPEEIAFTRNATEALQGLILNYRHLERGDAVMMADLDYGSIRSALAWLAHRRGAEVVDVAMPEPATYDGLIDFFQRSLEANPRVRLLLLTHVSHRTGLLLPVAEIVALARERGVDVIVDAAHSWGQVPLTVDELGADFVGFNLHKWIGAPLGVGLMYLRRTRLEAVAPDPSATEREKDAVSGRVHTGTSNFAALLSVPDALDYHEFIGGERKAARLRHLRSLWTSPVRDLPTLKVLTPDDPRLHAGITAFRLAASTSAEANKSLAERLLQDFGIFTVHRTGVAAGACVRVTPSVYNGPRDCVALAKALAIIAGAPSRVDPVLPDVVVRTSADVTPRRSSDRLRPG